jgi:hypothetical protein
VAVSSWVPPPPPARPGAAVAQEGGYAAGVTGPTVAGGPYWSATTGFFPFIAWNVLFANGSVNFGSKGSFTYVRAVRSGS